MRTILTTLSTLALLLAAASADPLELPGMTVNKVSEGDAVKYTCEYDGIRMELVGEPVVQFFAKNGGETAEVDFKGDADLDTDPVIVKVTEIKLTAESLAPVRSR